LFQACVPLAAAACRVTQKRYERESTEPEVGMSFTHANQW
jgi:hypothetical protein